MKDSKTPVANFNRFVGNGMEKGPLNGRFVAENLMDKKLTELFRDWSF